MKVLKLEEKYKMSEFINDTHTEATIAKQKDTYAR